MLDPDKQNFKVNVGSRSAECSYYLSIKIWMNFGEEKNVDKCLQSFFLCEHSLCGPWTEKKMKNEKLCINCYAKTTNK